MFQIRRFTQRLPSAYLGGSSFARQSAFLNSYRGFATKKDAGAKKETAKASKVESAPAAPQTVSTSRDGHRERVVVLGSGWAGTLFMKSLDPKKYAVSLVSPRNHFLFTPMLAGASVGTVSYQSICEPIRPLAMKKNARYYEAEATAVDVKSKTVHCKTALDQEFNMPYDKLVVACGYQANDFNTPGVLDHALFMKETGDAIKLRQHLLSIFEQASYEHMLDDDPNLSAEELAHMKKMLSFAIVGGGPTGVEFAGELTDFITKDAMRYYPMLKGLPEVHIITGDVLPMMDKSVADYAVDSLSKRAGVKFHRGCFVEAITKDSVKIKDGPEIPCGMTIWCAGIKPLPFARNVDLPKAENGVQILVNNQMQVKGLEDVYALGDCATIDGNRLPQTAQVAKQQAYFLAKNLNAGQPEITWPAFKFHNLGVMAYIGGGRATIYHDSELWNGIKKACPDVVMDKLGSWIAFLGWRSVYWSMQLSLRNRYLLCSEWLRTALFGRDLTRHNKPSKPL